MCYRISSLGLRGDHRAGVRQHVSDHGSQHPERRYDAGGDADGAGAESGAGERGHHRGSHYTGSSNDHDKRRRRAPGSSSNIIKGRQCSDQGHAGRSQG